MKKKAQALLASQSLKYKLKISFYLMSILPILICLYIVSNYILPANIGFKIDIAVSVLISIFIAAVGFMIIRQIVERIIAVIRGAKRMAAGDISEKMKIEQIDEIGDLGGALNQLTERIQNNMIELKNYGVKTAEINQKIQKRVIVVSGLLQIGSLISGAAKLREVLELVIEKARLLARSDAAYILFHKDDKESAFYVRSADGINSEALLEVVVGSGDPLYNRLISASQALILDKDNTFGGKAADSFCEKFKLKNTIIIPVYLKKKVVALLGIGNAEEKFVYKREDAELLDVFAKQIAIAVENDLLVNQVEKLEINDALTGLYNESFVHSRLKEEIKRAAAYQRPCAFMLFDIDNFKPFQQNFGSLQAEAILKKAASVIRDSVSDIDRVGRIGDDKFAIILPEKNKRQVKEIAENIRSKIEFVFSEETDPKKKITISAGVSENPLDGVNAEELVAVADERLKAAKERGKNRIVS